MPALQNVLVSLGLQSEAPKGVEKVEKVLGKFDQMQKDLQDGLTEIHNEVVDRADSIEEARERFKQYEEKETAKIEELEKTKSKAQSLHQGLTRLTEGVID